MGLAEAAAQAATKQREQTRTDASSRRDKLVEKAIGEKWESTWKHKGAGTGGRRAPIIDSHEVVSIDGATAVIAVCDGVKFLYSETYRNEGWGMLRTCPDCGALTKVHFYSLADVGQVHAAEQAKKPLPTHDHRCYANSVNALASRLLLEAKALKISVHDLAARAVDKAMERGGGF